MSNYKIIGKENKEIATDIALHPGELLRDELETRAITQKNFAIAIGLQPPHLNDILKGKRHISAKLALKIEQQLNVEASYWLQLQMQYDLAIAKKDLKAA
ncbi:MAG: HigA family addiction module antidote protein [Sphingobacteriales bacterium]|nr:HigA family addiction module antidote protein [Sphingobacteriales bacterium]